MRASPAAKLANLQYIGSDDGYGGMDSWDCVAIGHEWPTVGAIREWEFAQGLRSLGSRAPWSEPTRPFDCKGFG
jgi:hypothetical protein